MNYLFAAYAVIWTVIFVYTLMIGKRQKSIENEILYLKNMVANADLKNS